MSKPSSDATLGLATALADLPQRVRVHELARRAGLNSKQAIAALTAAGVEVASASSSVDRDVAERLLTALLGGVAAVPPVEPSADLVAEPSPGLFAEPPTAPPAGADEEGDESRHRRRRGRRGRGRSEDGAASGATDGAVEASADGASEGPGGDQPATGPSADAEPHATEQPEGDGDKPSRRRRRGGRGRRGSGRADAAKDADAGDDTEQVDTDQVDAVRGADDAADGGQDDDQATAADLAEDAGEDGDKSASRRRRRRRRRTGSADGSRDDDPSDTVVHVRETRTAESASVQGVRGSTRLEAKRQRRRDSRDSRRRPQILSEAEFLARRESVDRVMAVRQRGDLAQVALLEDGVLVEHFVSRSGAASMIGNVYLGRVQNVLPSMEAAFVDIGRGRNAVLYAGEVNWDIAGLEGKERRIETALSSGDTVLVQVSKDPIGHKGARLTTQISLPGRFLVYVPGGGATGISRKLPDTERKRLKGILDRIVPADAGVIIRTAAEGVGEDDLAGDVERLKAQWAEITAAADGASGKAAGAPTQLYAEPDTLIKVIRDLFNSDINRLLIDGDEAWASVSEYVLSVAPELATRVSRYVGDRDVFAAFRIDEQISKALQRKVHLPSGGSLVIDRTEAMTVIDVNTGKFTGSGGNLEETVTRNNLEAAEEIVRQLRLRDIGGIIVVDFIDMVLESNRELVLRRLTECLGRDRTRHQVAEVTSLGLVQMTRKRMGLGLVEAFSEPCPHCGGRGILLHDAPADTGAAEPDKADGGADRGARKGRKRGRHAADHDDDAKFEPLVVERVAADSKPDPRGPKPPALFRSAQPDSGEQDDAGSGGDEASAARRDAEHGPDLAADAGVERAAEPATDAAAEPAGEPAAGHAPQPAAEPSSEPVAAPAEAGPAAEPPATRPTRRRRAASRPAGAPTAASVAVDMVVPAASEPSDGAAHPAASSAMAADSAAQDGQPQDGHRDGAAGSEAPTAKQPRRRRAASRAAGPVTATAERQPVE